MPSYTYGCDNGHSETVVLSISEMLEFEKSIPACECGAAARRVYRAQTLIRFHEGWYEHIAPDPVYCTSAQQLADVARENGNRSKYVKDLGGLWNVKQDRRWV